MNFLKDSVQRHGAAGHLKEARFHHQHAVHGFLRHKLLNAFSAASFLEIHVHLVTMNILILVGTFKQHANIIHGKCIALFNVNEDARFNELLDGNLPTSLFWLQNETRCLDQNRLVVEARTDLDG